ncbi:hypothetical protein EOM75_12390 [Candidatus Falkowbacteria bacterium]|nr:hypothetical protein [Candidatus Falkowbacteria bacterium]
MEQNEALTIEKLISEVFEANITHQVSDYLNNSLKNVLSIEEANQKLLEDFGFLHFFQNGEDLRTLRETIADAIHYVSEIDRTEYGDFQTNLVLANKITFHLRSKNISPEVIIEPTCGIGNFIIASLMHFDNVKSIFGVEIYKPYVWECKFNIIDFYLSNPKQNKPRISIIHSNVFDFDFNKIADGNQNAKILLERKGSFRG